MIVCDQIPLLRQHVKQWQQQGKRIALVPTMGNLHLGHLSLIAKAKQHADITIATIFINPTQFNQQSDLDNYPRSLEQDLQQLKTSDCDLVFTPTTQEIYGDQPTTTRVEITGISEHLEGASRPGHFSGVATIVAKLFNLTNPNIAIFGEKDFQQLILIRQMVRELNFDIKILSQAIYREPDGLAMSSRNSRLTPSERKIAPALHQQLLTIKEAIQQGNQNFQSLTKKASKTLDALGFQTDYIEICRPKDLSTATVSDTEIVILAAAQLGKPRLIDNITLHL